MAIKGLNVGKTWEYELLRDPDKGTPEATKFILSTLDSRVMGHITDLATKFKVNPGAPDEMAETSVNFNEMNYVTCQFGMESVENAPGEFKTVGRRLGGRSYKIVDPEWLSDNLTTADISELANEIRSKNELAKDEVKN